MCCVLFKAFNNLSSNFLSSKNLPRVRRLFSFMLEGGSNFFCCISFSVLCILGTSANLKQQTEREEENSERERKE